MSVEDRMVSRLRGVPNDTAVHAADIIESLLDKLKLAREDSRKTNMQILAEHFKKIQELEAEIRKLNRDIGSCKEARKKDSKNA